MMTQPERYDGRVAMIPLHADASTFQGAIFEAKRIEDAIEQRRESWLMDVLNRDALTVHLQPLIQYPPGRLHGYECLVRGVGDDGSMISPKALFDAARITDMLFVLDQKARITAVRTAAKSELHDTKFFINFIPTAIYNPEHCLQSTLAAVSASNLNPSQVVFEVVETEAITDRKHLSRILQYYRDNGFQIALDDVGAGYSSLLSLSELRPDYIKLDGEFVRRAAESALEAKIVRDLAETARQHGIITIAEGIETEDQMRFVIEAGIPITQGYLHGKPRPSPLVPQEFTSVIQKISQLESARAQAYEQV